MRRGFLPRCRMAARKDIHSQGRWQTSLRGKREIWPARSCSPSSVQTKVVSFVEEEWVPYLMDLVSSLLVIPLSVLIGTPCTWICLRIVAVGC